MSALHIRFGNAKALPLETLLSMIPSLPRQALDRLVERAIDHMDELDGDADLELGGDELDTGNAEDEHAAGHPWGHVGPGCAISDPDEDCGDAELEKAL